MPWDNWLVYCLSSVHVRRPRLLRSGVYIYMMVCCMRWRITQGIHIFPLRYLHAYLKWEIMGISRQHVIPMIITCMLQGTLCDTGIPRTFYGGNIFSVGILMPVWIYLKSQIFNLNLKFFYPVGIFISYMDPEEWCHVRVFNLTTCETWIHAHGTTLHGPCLK